MNLARTLTWEEGIKHLQSAPLLTVVWKLSEEARPALKNIRLAPEAKKMQWALKRVVDILGSSLGLIFLSPVLFLVMALIKLESPGPCFIRQRRVGYLGKDFYMYKFRSMVEDADDQLKVLLKHNETNDFMFKMKQDPRITKIGYWIRRYSIDELPQLWNVLHGEMSLVGPRPPLPDEVKRYPKSFLVRFSTKPGLTCFWQINGRSDIKDFKQVVEFDARYIREWNLWLDFKILLQTLPVVILAKGAA